MTNSNIKTRKEGLGDAEVLMMAGRIRKFGANVPPENKGTWAKLAKQFEKKDQDEETLRMIYRLATEPKTASDPYYQEFLKAFADGAFSRDSDLLHMLLKSLEKIQTEKAGTHETKITKEILRNLGDLKGRIGERTEKNYSKQILEASKKDEKEMAVEGKSAMVIIKTAQTGSRATDIIKEKEKLKRLKLGNWTVENPPAGLMEKLHKAYDEQYKLALKAEKTTDQKELAEIDRQIDEIKKEIQPAKDEYQAYLTRVLSQFRAQKRNEKEMGVPDLRYLEKLTYFAPETIRNERKKKSLKFGEIFFDPATEEDPDVAGSMNIKDEHGNEMSDSYLLKQTIALEGHEEISSPEDFDEKFGAQMEYVNIKDAPGETFEAENQVYKKEPFKILAVERIAGKWVVKLEREVVTIPREKISASVDPSLYFERKQKEFSLGEFGAFIKREGYRRVVRTEEMQDVANKAADANAKRCRKFVEGATPEEVARFEATGVADVENFTIPFGNAKQRVELTGPDGQKIAGILREKGDAAFEMEPMAIGGVPFMKPTVRRIPIKGRNLMELANKGNIKNMPSDSSMPSQMPPSMTEEGFEQAEFGNMPQDETLGGKPRSQEPEKKRNEAAKVQEEACDYDVVHKVGGMSKEERGFLSTMWSHTHFLSVSDLWHMGKTLWEYHLRRFERRQKERYAMVGKDLPYFAPEMQRIKQAAEIEQVNQFKESFEDFGVYEIQNRLRHTKNQDELKAAFTVLAEKGQLRWDDIETWKNLNKFVDPKLAVPIPSNGDPFTQVSEKDKRTGFAFLKEAIDSLWGEGTYNEWFAKNKSTFQQSAKSYYEKGKELEGVDGGHARRLAELLRAHKEGAYVDPHEYEGLILHSIEAGKSTMQAKLYYMIEGIAAENHEGRTILSFDRMAHINSEMLTRFPILEYLCAKATRKDGDKTKASRFAMDDYKRWVKWFDEDKHMNFEPTKSVDEFLWRYVIPSSDTQNRINKAIRNGENLDHDDMFAYLPPASEQVLTDACGATTGDKKFLTVEGYANAFPGFNQYFRSLAENDNRTKLTEAVKSWVRFEGIMTWRFQKEKGNHMQRMDETTLRTGTIVTPDIPPKVFIKQLNEVVQQIVEAYDSDELRDNFALLSETTGDINSDQEQMKRQQKINYAFLQFGGIFERVVKSDGGKKMKDIVAAANLTGMPFLKSEEKDRRRAERGDMNQMEYENESNMPFNGSRKWTKDAEWKPYK